MTGTAQRGVAIGATIVLLAAIGWTVLRPASSYHVTAYFNQAVGLYKGSSVRVLGLEVGTIDDVVPEGTRVRVEMSIDKKYPVPANAEAVILAPSLVSDRYVQFAFCEVTGLADLGADQRAAGREADDACARAGRRRGRRHRLGTGSPRGSGP